MSASVKTLALARKGSSQQRGHIYLAFRAQTWEPWALSVFPISANMTFCPVRYEEGTLLLCPRYMFQMTSSFIQLGICEKLPES